MKPVRIIATHRYVRLSDLKDRQTELTGLCERLQAKGYIVLSSEGIDLRVAGEPESIELLLGRLQRWPEFADLTPRETAGEVSPFRRMAVRVKKELIRLGCEHIDPANSSTRRLAPRELARWLDERKPLALLDVRTRHEVASGTFVDALSLSVLHFHDLPAAGGQLSERLKQQPLLVFCTDGLRSRKAALLLAQRGFEDVYELDAGIVAYLHQCGSRYFTGRCVDVDPRLSSHVETLTIPCARCGLPLTESDREHSRYVAGESCASCYQPTATEMSARLAQRKDELRRLTATLPGSVPHDQFRFDRPIQFSEAPQQVHSRSFKRAFRGANGQQGR